MIESLLMKRVLFVIVVLVAVLLVAKFLVSGFFARNSVVISSSQMSPTFTSGQRVFYTRTVNHPVKRGTIVLFTKNNQEFIARVIALPGETFQIKESQVFINGTVLDEPYLDENQDKRGSSETIEVPKENYVLMIDWRSLNPSDYKIVPFQDIVGVVTE